MALRPVLSAALLVIAASAHAAPTPTDTPSSASSASIAPVVASAATTASPTSAVGATALAGTAAVPVIATARPSTVAVASPTPLRMPKPFPVRATVKTGHTLELDWRELLPEGERAHFSPTAPAPMHDARGEGGPPAMQAQDFNVNKSLDGATIRLPGFIVPLDAQQSGLSEFLLVPYFGSCIHVPPPPPNQIVYVHTSNRATVDSIYDAYWITGKLHLQNKATRLGATAYELSAEKIEVYRY